MPEFCKLVNECRKHTLKGFQGREGASGKDGQVTDSLRDERKTAACVWLSWMLPTDKGQTKHKSQLGTQNSLCTPGTGILKDGHVSIAVLPCTEMP